MSLRRQTRQLPLQRPHAVKEASREKNHQEGARSAQAYQEQRFTPDSEDEAKHLAADQGLAQLNRASGGGERQLQSGKAPTKGSSARPARHATCTRPPRTDSKASTRQGTGRSYPGVGALPPSPPVLETPYGITWTWDPSRATSHVCRAVEGRAGDSSCFQLRKTSVDDEAG